MTMTGSAWIAFSKLKFYKRIRYRMKRNSWHSVQSRVCRWTSHVSFKLNYSCAAFLPYSSAISFKLSSNRRLASMFACYKVMFLPAWFNKRQCSFSAFCTADYYSRCAPNVQRKVILLLWDEHRSDLYRPIRLILAWYFCHRPCQTCYYSMDPYSVEHVLTNSVICITWTHQWWRYGLRMRKHFKRFVLVKWNDIHLWFMEQIWRSYARISLIVPSLLYN